MKSSNKVVCWNRQLGKWHRSGLRAADDGERVQIKNQVFETRDQQRIARLLIVDKYAIDQSDDTSPGNGVHAPRIVLSSSQPNNREKVFLHFHGSSETIRDEPAGTKDFYLNFDIRLFDTVKEYLVATLDSQKKITLQVKEITGWLPSGDFGIETVFRVLEMRGLFVRAR